MLALFKRVSFWPPSMVYISVIITYKLQITFLHDVNLFLIGKLSPLPGFEPRTSRVPSQCATQTWINCTILEPLKQSSKQLLHPLQDCYTFTKTKMYNIISLSTIITILMYPLFPSPFTVVPTNFIIYPLFPYCIQKLWCIACLSWDLGPKKPRPILLFYLA